VIPGHNITLSALGVFILWFGWFGFNGCSTLRFEGDAIELASKIFVNTNMAAAVATCTSMITSAIRYKKPDISMTLNGALAGLVAITAGCDTVSLTGAFFIGLCAGIVVVFSVEFIDKILKVDDPVGAVGVHGVCGALGTILVGLLSTENGLLYTGKGFFFLTQIIGVISVITWVSAIMFLVFSVLKSTIGLRVKEQDEVEGMEKSEHGLLNAYADFLPVAAINSYGGKYNYYKAAQDSNGEDIEDITEKQTIYESYESAADFERDEQNAHITKVEIILKQNKFEELKAAMNDIGVTGMTVTQILGCGMQKGATEFYRGTEFEMQLLPKVRVEMVIAKVPVKKVVETARRVLHTGHIGDGKIFIYRVADVIKVRTGERGYDALQGVDDL
ncbi:MAG TPA: P-II family nitrogen regulator, partial [Lachnospiraceae bacterium]|nr:P-II family nitrogen regulator [Lachnospiraceae bacterium]